jgi:PAS domain S-box-containing protein
MRIQSRLAMSIVVSLLVSAMIATVAFYILWDTKTELERSRVYDEAITKINALNVLLAALKEGLDPSDITQIRNVSTTLGGLLKKMSSTDTLEQSLITNTQKNNEALRVYLGQTTASITREGLVLPKEHSVILESQILMKVSQISDGIYRLRAMSQSRVTSDQTNAGVTVLLLLAALILSNSLIAIFSGRKIVQSENLLLESAEKLRAAQKIAKLGWWSFDFKTERTSWSGAIKTIYEIEEKEIDTESIIKLVHPDDLTYFTSKREKIIDNGSGEIEYRVLLDDGRAKWIWGKANTLYGKDGTPDKMVGVVQDITERKMVKNEVVKSEKRFATLFRKSPLWITLSTLEEGVYLDVNDSFSEITGYSREEVVGRSSNELEIWIDPQARKVALKKIKEKGSLHNYEIDFRSKGGGTGTALWSAEVAEIDGTPSLISILRDITDRKGREEALRQSEQRANAQRQALVHLTLEVDTVKGTLKQALESMVQTMSTTLDVARASVWFLSPDESELRCLTLYESDKQKHRSGDVLATSKFPSYFEVIRTENRIYASDAQNDPRTKELTGFYLDPLKVTSLLDAGIFTNGKLVGVVSFEHIGPRRTWFSDEEAFVSTVVALVAQWLVSSERKRAEEGRKASEENYQILFDEMLSGFTHNEIICDAHGRPVDSRYLAINPAFERITGFKTKDVRGKRLFEVFPDLESDWIEPFGRVALTGQPEHFEKEASALGIWFDVMVFCPAPNQYACTFIDITDRKKLESQLIQSQKMEAIGTLSGGIAHDFNNILAAMMGYTELAMDDVPDGSPVSEDLKEVLKAGYRAKDLVRQILSFSRASKQEEVPLEVSLVLKEALKLLRPAIPTTIGIREELKDFEDKVLADPIQIHQVIMNLCTNAYQAMEEEGGVLEISLATIEIDDEESNSYPDLESGKYQRLTVADTGVGMDRNTLDRVFEPFFTTKKVDQGTGMGLSVVHGIVKAHGGTVTAYSEPGKGSTFNVYLPVYQGKEIAGEGPEEAQPVGGDERILLVDDEEALAAAGKAKLQRLGYQVTATTSSVKALEYFKKHPNAFDLIITDYTMPEMIGTTLSQEILAIRPDMPIIIATGFSMQLTPEKANSLGIKRMVMKPLVGDRFARVVREVLDE